MHNHRIIISQIRQLGALAIFGIGLVGFFLRNPGCQGKSEEVLIRLLHDLDGLPLGFMKSAPITAKINCISTIAQHRDRHQHAPDRLHIQDIFDSDESLSIYGLHERSKSPISPGYVGVSTRDSNSDFWPISPVD